MTNSTKPETIARAESAEIRARAMAALRLGVFDLAEEAIARGDATLAELVDCSAARPAPSRRSIASRCCSRGCRCRRC